MIANGGKMALDYVLEGKIPDLILLDIMMPDLDGYSVCTILKNEDSTKDIPIIFISAMDQKSDEQEGLNLGAVDYIKKPFIPSIVLARVETQLKLSNSLREIKTLYSNSRIMNKLVKYKNNQIEMIFDNLDEGYLVIDEGLRVQSEHSKKCDVIFGFDISGKSILEIFSAFKGFDAEVDKEVLLELFELEPDEIPKKAKVYLELLPDELEKDEEIFSVRYSMIFSEDQTKRLLIILENITENIMLRKGLELERKKLIMIVNVVCNLEEYKLLIRDALWFFKEKIYEIIVRRNYENIFDLFVKTHTFKGSFGQMSILEVVRLLDRLENLLASYSENLTENDAKELLRQVKGLEIDKCLESNNSKIESYLGFSLLNEDCNNDLISINRKILKKVEDEIKTHPSIDHKDIILEIMGKIRYKSLFCVLKAYCDYAKRLSYDLDKGVIVTKITGEDIFLDPDKFNDMLNSLIHIFRNIVDHGIETPEERVQKGKETCGRVLCHIQTDGKEVELTISDDGGGVNLDDLKEKIKLFTDMSEQEIEDMDINRIVNYIFEDRISSRDGISYISGRGIGLSAVKRALNKIGGSIHVVSSEGKGSSFVINFSL